MLEKITIDERTWAEGNDARRLEWNAAIREMLLPGEAVLREDVNALHVTITEQEVQLEASAEESVVGTIAIPHHELADVIQEYVDVVRQIARADAHGGIARLEALDMAKKATHDKAARLLKRRCRELAIDHPTARRLFTLLLGLKVDTTRLMGVHGHRRVR
ncbi:MAG: UPF0262 family protein [Myxococcota bacterium]